MIIKIGYTLFFLILNYIIYLKIHYGYANIYCRIRKEYYDKLKSSFICLPKHFAFTKNSHES